MYLNSLMTTIKNAILDINFSPSFNQQLTAALREIKIAFRESLELFQEDTEHQVLRNHPLKEQFTGYRSIDVTNDYRAIFREVQAGKIRVIIFYYLGTHKQLYE